MAERSFPFDIDPITLGPQETFEEDFSELLYTSIPDGILQGFSHAVVGRDVQIGTGRAAVKGYGYVNTDTESFEVPLNPSSNPRTDRIVLRLDKSQNSVLLTYREGVAQAAQPSPLGSMAPPLAPARTLTVWDVLVLRITVNPNNSAVFNVFREDTRQILPSAGHAFRDNLETYQSIVQTNGQVAFLDELGASNGNFGRWVGTRNNAFTEVLSVGPWRQLRKQGDQSVPGDQTWRSLTGWTTINSATKPFGNTGITLSGGGFILQYTGYWEIECSVWYSSQGSTGHASARFRNATTGETITSHRGHVGNAGVSAEPSGKIWANGGDQCFVEVFASGGTRLVPSTSITRLDIRLFCGEVHD